jgi:hypothetical protein
MQNKGYYLVLIASVAFLYLFIFSCKQGGGKPVGDYETLIEIEDTVIKVNGRVVDVDAPIDTWLTYFEGKVDSVSRINGFTQAFRYGVVRVGSDLHEQPWPISSKSRKGQFLRMQIYFSNNETGYQYPDTGQYRKVRVIYNGFDLNNDFKNMEHLNKYLRKRGCEIFRRPASSTASWYSKYPLERFKNLYEFHFVQFKIATGIENFEKLWFWEISMERLKKE